MYIDDLKMLINNMEKILQNDKRWSENGDEFLRQKIKRIAKGSAAPIISYLPIENENIQFNKKKYWSTDTKPKADIIKLPSNVMQPNNTMKPNPSTVMKPNPTTVMKPNPTTVMKPNPIMNPSTVMKPNPSTVMKPNPIMQPTTVMNPSTVMMPDPVMPKPATINTVKDPITIKPVEQTKEEIVKIPDLFANLEKFKSLNSIVDNMTDRIDYISK